MIQLLGGIKLPEPRAQHVFDCDVSRYKMGKVVKGLWKDSYNYCLVMMHTCSDVPMHKMVIALASGMKTDLPYVKEPKAIALRFLGEMEIQKYIKVTTQEQTGFTKKKEREVSLTRKLLKLGVASIIDETRAIKYPFRANKDVIDDSFEVRKGSNSTQNKKALNIIKGIANEPFTINHFTLDVLKKYPPDVSNLSKRLAFDRTLSTANYLLEDTFRFQHFADSRGREYDATTCGVSPQGADHEKALLLHTHSRVLTPEGFNALVEAAWGYSEIEFSVDVMCNHARYPDKYKEEWLAVDKPYSYLSCANMISTYMYNPYEPIAAFTPLDGRCSGLQHWSALMKTNSITKHIGMHQEEADRDIYERVADDWSESLDQEFKYIATRKAAKIPVMTFSYNATRMTSQEHLKSLFGERSRWNYDSESYEVVESGLEYATTMRLGSELYDGLNDTFKDLTVAVKFVSECARRIAKDGNHQISWVTPDGVYAMQTKVEPKELEIKVTLSNKETLKVLIDDYSGKNPFVAKHVSAIAPNIIHSLDACHLRMVARRLHEVGDPMVFIHDSFATHSNYRGNLYRYIVEEFIDLYSGNYLNDLKIYWEKKYKLGMPEVPKLGSWKSENLRELKLFFK